MSFLHSGPKKTGRLWGSVRSLVSSGSWMPWKGSRNLGAMSTDWSPPSSPQHHDIRCRECLALWLLQQTSVGEASRFSDLYNVCTGGCPSVLRIRVRVKAGRWPPNKRQPFATVCSQHGCGAWKPKVAAHSKVCWAGARNVCERTRWSARKLRRVASWMVNSLVALSSMDGKLRQLQRPPRPK